jgi:integrase
VDGYGWGAFPTAAWRAWCSAGRSGPAWISLRFAGHSLRAGLASSAGGVSERAIMNQTGHRSLTMVRRYIRDGELFRDDNAARGAGL